MAKVMVSLPEDLLAEIDRVAKETGRTRSGLIQQVWRLYTAGKLARVAPGDKPGVREAWDKARASMKGVSLGKDSTEIIREARDKLDARDRERVRRTIESRER
jgi:metal-responsive CopG/Arc/MetJ family transcriptional regulator